MDQNNGSVCNPSRFNPGRVNPGRDSEGTVAAYAVRFQTQPLPHGRGSASEPEAQAEDTPRQRREPQLALRALLQACGAPNLSNAATCRRGVIVVAGLLSLAATPAFGQADGHIIGKLENASEVVEVFALDRENEAVIAGAVDAASGAFRFTHLDRKRHYDIAIKTKTGRIEGVDMRFMPDAAGKATKRPGDDKRPFETEDAEQIRRLVIKPQRFMNQVELLALRGEDRTAVAVVNLVRTRKFHSGKGEEIVWRVELWYYRWENGGWARVPNTERILYRERFEKKTWQAMRVRFDPALGGVAPGSAEAPRRLTYAVPTEKQTTPVAGPVRPTTRPSERQP